MFRRKKESVDVTSKLKQSIGNITREELLRNLYETEKLAWIDWNWDSDESSASRVDNYKKVVSKVNWLDKNLNFRNIHCFFRDGVSINKSMFTERQYNCFISALLNLKNNKFAASFHEIYDFLENHKISNTDELTDLEILILAMWSYLFKKNFDEFIKENNVKGVIVYE